MEIQSSEEMYVSFPESASGLSPKCCKSQTAALLLHTHTHTHTIHSPLVRGINCGDVWREREMRMTLNYWLYLLFGQACGAGMGGFSEEGRGL